MFVSAEKFLFIPTSQGYVSPDCNFASVVYSLAQRSDDRLRFEHVWSLCN